MGNIFDGIQDTINDITGKSFGFAATWSPFDESPLQDATVLYKDATDREGLSDSDFNIERYVMEYPAGKFTGLKQSVDAGENEKVRIELKKDIWFEFAVRRMETKYDGKTIIAFLNKPTQV